MWVQMVQRAGDEVVISRWLADQSSSWTVDLIANADEVFVAVSPFAPLTTVPMSYKIDFTTF
jgi:hypothetical protein